MKFICHIIAGWLIAASLCAADATSPADSWELAKNDAIARKFINDCKMNKTCPEPGLFGWEKFREYWAKVPELRSARDLFEKYDNELKDILMQDEEYKKNHDTLVETLRNTPPEEKRAVGLRFKAQKDVMYKRLEKTSEAYREARRKREDSLFESNIKTFEYIIDDYKARGELFPVDWIPGQVHHH